MRLKNETSNDSEDGNTQYYRKCIFAHILKKERERAQKAHKH